MTDDKLHIENSDSRSQRKSEEDLKNSPCVCKVCVETDTMSQLIKMRPCVNYTVFEHIIIIGLRAAASRHDLSMIWT